MKVIKGLKQDYKDALQRGTWIDSHSIREQNEAGLVVGVSILLCGLMILILMMFK